jgi:hypothetical protein
VLASLFAPWQTTTGAPGHGYTPHSSWTGWDAVFGDLGRRWATDANGHDVTARYLGASPPTWEPRLPPSVAMFAAVVLLVAGVVLGALRRPRLRGGAQAVVAGAAGAALAVGGWRLHERVAAVAPLLGPASTSWPSWAGPGLLAVVCVGSGLVAARATADGPGVLASARELAARWAATVGFLLAAACFWLPFRVAERADAGGTFQWLLSGWDAITGDVGAFAATDGHGHDASSEFVLFFLGGGTPVPAHSVGKVMLVALLLVLAGAAAGTLEHSRRRHLATAALAGLAVTALVVANLRLATRTTWFVRPAAPATASAVFSGYGFWTAFALLTSVCIGCAAAYLWPFRQATETADEAPVAVQ